MPRYLIIQSVYYASKWKIKHHPEKACLPVFQSIEVSSYKFVQPAEDIHKLRREIIWDLNNRFLAGGQYDKQYATQRNVSFSVPENVYYKVYVSITPLQDNRSQGTFPPEIENPLDYQYEVRSLQSSWVSSKRRRE